MAFRVCSKLQAQKLSFNDKGDLKTMQFADMHYFIRNIKSDKRLSLMTKVLETENTDLIVFPGYSDYLLHKTLKEHH